MPHIKEESNTFPSLSPDMKRQVEDVAKSFAITLKNSAAGTAVEIPDWISIKAQNWIVRNADEFSTYVVGQYRKMMKDEKEGRPCFILPDPEKAA